MNYIGLDVSLNSTAVFIQSDDKITILSFTNKKDNNIYIKELEHFGVKFYFLYKEKDTNYSKNEVIKIIHHDKLSDDIVNAIKDNINLNEKTICNLEGYSFSRNTSSILDIVSLTTLIRSKLIKNINQFELNIISPSSLKKESCGMVYGFDKKRNTKNNQGISGGKFKKPEMFRAIIEGNINTPLLGMLNSYVDLMNRKKIPNPIEDIIDATFACKIKIYDIENVVR